MESIRLYNKLDTDFKVNEIGCEPWDLQEIKKYVSPLFLKRNEGLMLDHSPEIQKVYSMTFPDTSLLQAVLEKNETDILVFSQHAQSWQFLHCDPPMTNIPTGILEQMKQQRVSLYTIHIPLDNAGAYSTSVTFAKAINVAFAKNGFEYEKALTGLYGKTEYENIHSFSAHLGDTIGHVTKVYNYGSEEISNQTVAIVAGCGNEADVIEELVENNVNTLITGFSTDFADNPEHDFADDAIAAHEIARKNKINIIGATHYSTEKYACMAMVPYFKNLGIPAEFLEGKPNLNDL